VEESAGLPAVEEDSGAGPALGEVGVVPGVAGLEAPSSQLTPHHRLQHVEQQHVGGDWGGGRVGGGQPGHGVPVKHLLLLLPLPRQRGAAGEEGEGRGGVHVGVEGRAVAGHQHQGATLHVPEVQGGGSDALLVHQGEVEGEGDICEEE